jgi:hypothetical protein
MAGLGMNPNFLSTSASPNTNTYTFSPYALIVGLQSLLGSAIPPQMPLSPGRAQSQSLGTGSPRPVSSSNVFALDHFPTISRLLSVGSIHEYERRLPV